MTPDRFKGKICIVTGSSGGIGKAVVNQLKEEGAAKVFEVDITNASHIVDLSEEWDAHDFMFNNFYGKLAVDCVFNCAGIMIGDFEDIMGANFKSVVNVCKNVMRYTNQGAIVNISSIHSQRTTPNEAIYAASKAAIEAYSRSIASDKIRVNCVEPGAVDTPMLRSNPDFDESWIVNTPESIAEVICFLGSDDSRAINGATIVADKGVLAKL